MRREETSLGFQASRRVRHQDVHQQSKAQSKTPVINITRRSQAIICWMVTRGSHVSLQSTDYQEFVSILHAVTGHNVVTAHKDVITKRGFIEGVISELIDEIKNKALEGSSRRVRSRSRRGHHRWNCSTQWKESIKGVNTHASGQLS